MPSTLTVTPDPDSPLDVVLDVVTTVELVSITYRQQLPLPQTDWVNDLTSGTAISVSLVGEWSNTYRLSAIIFDVGGPAEAPSVTYNPVPPAGWAGWPTDADLQARLGLKDGDDTDRVASANAAAQADAVAICDLDPAMGCEDHGEFEAVLLLGQWWYENRNRPEGLDSLNPVASPYYRRVAIGILQRGRIPVA